MLDRFLEHVRSKNLIDPQAPTLVGYSGGADSTCLLHLLHRGGFDVIAGHLHHGQREEADKELEQCEVFCSELDLPFVSGRADVPKIAAGFKVGLEEAGRLARYQFFEAAAAAADVKAIATAHTRDDQVETILLNIIRGAGLTGLWGMPEQRGQIVRPMLPFSRAETRAYCEEQNLWTHDDPANFDLNFSRVRVRHEILPSMATINEDIAGAILRLSEIAKSEDDFLNGMAAAALEQSEIHLNGDLDFLTLDNEVAFGREILLHLPPVLLRRALRLAVSAVGGALDQHQTVIAEEGIRGGAVGSITCEGGEVSLDWNRERITARIVAPVASFRSNLTLPGETISDELNWVITADFGTRPPGEIKRAGLDAFIHSGAVRGPLYFRNWKPGDQFMPLGFEGHRKVADLMSEAALTINARSRLPVICDMVGPLWIPGVCIDERCRVEEGAKAVTLKLRQLR
jgi:tRNA(Ile)-lysidine synthase